jgi:hypothetical protein
MKLVMTLVVRDEADIIRANLDYHLANGVDFVIVTDHGSSDGTSEILREYERMKVAQVIRDDTEGHHQSRRVTHMADLARSEHRASWVIHNDADEFWWPQVGSLRDVFASLPERYAQIVVPRRNFRPAVDSIRSGEPFHQRLLYRDRDSGRLARLPKVAHRPMEGLVVAPGNHSLSPPGLPCVPSCGLLEILHFPMRSYEQFEHKVLQTGMGYEQVEDRSPGVGAEQLELLALQRAGDLRDYYERLVLDERSLQEGLRDGSVVLDRRLADFMRDLSTAATARRVRPDEPHAREILGWLTSGLAEAERSEEQLQMAQVRNLELVEQLQDLRGDLAALTVRMEQVSDELACTSNALHLLRTSKLVRHTAWARRIYYWATGGAGTG